MKNILSAAYGVLFAMVFSFIVSAHLALPFVPCFIVILLVSAFVPQPKSALKGVVLEQWATYIMERFWRDNQFLRNAYDDSQYVVSGRIVHIPQPGAKPNVVKNRTQFPGTAVRRTDTDVLYPLDEYSTDATHIPNIDAIHLSYDKQDSVLGDHMETLDEVVADDMLLKWAEGGTVIKTTGGKDAVQVGPVAGQTGNRLGLHHSDLKKLMIKANTDNVPKKDRYALIDDNMYEYFYDSLSETQQRDFSRFVDAENGIVGKLHGWNILTRSSVVTAGNDNVVKPLGSALGATDSLGCLAWYKNSVAYAIGDKKLYQDVNNPIFYGDVHSAVLMAGGRVRRADKKGIYTILQGAVA